MSARPRILVFDSGLGGLSIVNALRDFAPEAQLAYAADNAAFPYGDWKETALVEQMIVVLGGLVAKLNPDIVVVACNTASTIGLKVLRQEFEVPFIGTVPAIKPAANLTKTGYIGVLATPGTVEREYTKALIETYAFHCQVKLHGAVKLAEIAEAKMVGQRIDLEALREQVAPVFFECKSGRTDVVVLGCSHYPFLIEELEKIAPWPVVFIDPAPAIARQVDRVSLAKRGAVACWQFANHAMFTKDGEIPDFIVELLRGFGFDIVVKTS